MPHTIPENDHLKFNKASTWVPLFDVMLPDNPQYYTPAQEAIEADGHIYMPFPVSLADLRDTGEGEVATVQLIASNIAGALGDYIRRNGSIDGETITFKVWSVEEQRVIREESLEIISVGPITPDTITLELGTFNPFLTQMLQEKFLTDFCWNRYKGKGCWITKIDGTFLSPSGFSAGSPDSCTRRLEDCERHNNVLRFNSFPGIPGSSFVAGGGFV